MRASPKAPSNRKFGLVFSGIFLFLGWYFSGAERAWPIRAGIVLAVAFLVIALARPALLQPLNRAWMAFGEILGKFVSPIFVGIVYFVLVTPYALIARLFGRDELKLRDRAGESYWIPRDRPAPSAEDFTRQY